MRQMVLAILMAVTISCSGVLAQGSSYETFSIIGSDDSIQAYDNALQADPGNYSIWINRAQALTYQGRLNESVEAYQKALDLIDETLEKDPQNAEAWKMRGTALVYLGQQDEAIKSYEMAIEIFDRLIEENSNDSESWWLKAECLDIMGSDTAAIEAYDKVIELNSSKAVGAWIRKTEIFFADPRKYNESLQSFDKAVELMPNDAARIMDSVWKENGSSISITVWGDKDQLIRIALGRHNESTGNYDRTLEIFSKSVSGWLTDKDIEYNLTNPNKPAEF